MNLGSGESEARFGAYVEGLASVLPGERKSVEPMATKTAPARTAAQHQSLLHFVGVAPWSDEKVLAKVREMVLPAIAQHGPIEAWIIDDTAFPKQGTHSVGVHHQYCGQLSAVDHVEDIAPVAEAACTKFVTTREAVAPMQTVVLDQDVLDSAIAGMALDEDLAADESWVAFERAN
jgi:SRSO17 transposase